MFYISDATVVSKRGFLRVLILGRLIQYLFSLLKYLKIVRDECVLNSLYLPTQ